MKHTHETFLEHASSVATHWTGSSLAFALACGTIVVWLITGPFCHFSDTWQLVINTSTTIITFLMVFLIQRSQNKDSQAIHLKLNELVASSRRASNRLICAEQMSEQDLQVLQEHFARIVELAKADGEITQSHSLEEAEDRHREKNVGSGT